MIPRLSDRGRSMPASPIRKLSTFADDAKKRGIHVYHLNIGQPDLETPQVMRDRLKSLDDRVLAYSPSAGTPAFVAAMQQYYKQLGIEVNTNEIISTAGGSEAILFAMYSCANSGDEALLCEPFYTNYTAFATMGGIRLVPLTTRGEDGFHLPPRHEWEAKLTARTRFVIVCNPNNPTGTVYSKEELQMVLQFCKDHGLFLISDEVYREFSYEGGTATSALQLEGGEDHVIVVDSLSKRFSACGIRLGCFVTRNRQVHDAALRMAQGRLSPPGIAQHIAIAAKDLGPDYYKGIIDEYRKRRDLLFEELNTIPGVFLRKPEGAFYMIVRVPVDDAEDFARWMLNDFDMDGATVMVTPAAGFYGTPGLGRDEVRIAYVLNEKDLKQAVAILREGLTQYAKREVKNGSQVGA